MKKEKALRIELPQGAEYRRVEVTDSGISIIYAEESVDTVMESSEAETTKSTQVVESEKPFINRRVKRAPRFEASSISETSSQIPTSKPTPLIGGTDVYQKDNGTNYWYCKIKGGRDEFMYLYFGDLTSDDLLYDAEGKERRFYTAREREFKINVLNALEHRPESGFVWIPVYEPSKDSDGNLQYVSGEKVLRELNCYTWEETFNNYSPENGSRMASMTTYHLLLLRWIKDGIATVEQIANDSAEIGHFYDSPNAKGYLEKTGERQFGGLYGFVGNTYKVVKDSEAVSGFSNCGSSYAYTGRKIPLADVVHDSYPYLTMQYGVGLIELIR